MVEMMSVPIGNLRKPGEVGLQESDLLDRMPDGETLIDEATQKIRLVSLGCYCGPKLSFKKIGRGAETLPFDWLRTRVDGLLHFMRNDFDGFYEWSTKQTIDSTKMTIYRGYYHSFWHDDPTDPAMHDRYDRRIERFKEINAHSAHVLFVRTVPCSAEVAKGPELLAELKKQFGKFAYLLLMIDFQYTAQGPAMVGGHPDLLVYYLNGDVHAKGDGAPYTEPIKVALDWAAGRPVAAMQFTDMDVIVDCTDATEWGLTGLQDVPAFEDEPPDPSAPRKRTIQAIPSPLTDQPVVPTLSPSVNIVPIGGATQPTQNSDVTPVVHGRVANPALNVESDLLEQIGLCTKAAADDIVLVSLGCFCGPKLSFQQMGRGAETLPFDWCRVSLDGLLHFINNDFEGYFDYITRSEMPGSHMVMYRSFFHSFWHDNPDHPDMQEKYKRRIVRFHKLKEHMKPILFVRAISSMDELLRADELCNVLTKRYGESVGLLLIADFQASTLGAITVDGHEDFLVYFMGSKDRGGAGNEFAPYQKPVQMAIDWINGEPFEAGCVDDLRSLHLLANGVGDLAHFGDFDAFEPLPAGCATAAEAHAARRKSRAAEDAETKSSPARGKDGANSEAPKDARDCSCYHGLFQLVFGAKKI